VQIKNTCIMIAVISGDIIASRKLEDQGVWLEPLQNLLNTWGKSPKDWKLGKYRFYFGCKIDISLWRFKRIKRQKINRICFDRNITELWNRNSRRNDNVKVN